eukprot:PhF_6_TR40474/c0_g1_i1/m.60509
MSQLPLCPSTAKKKIVSIESLTALNTTEVTYLPTRKVLLYNEVWFCKINQIELVSLTQSVVSPFGDMQACPLNTSRESMLKIMAETPNPSFIGGPISMTFNSDYSVMYVNAVMEARVREVRLATMDVSVFAGNGSLGPGGDELKLYMGCCVNVPALQGTFFILRHNVFHRGILYMTCHWGIVKVSVLTRYLTIHSLTHILGQGNLCLAHYRGYIFLTRSGYQGVDRSSIVSGNITEFIPSALAKFWGGYGMFMDYRRRVLYLSTWNSLMVFNFTLISQGMNIALTKLVQQAFSTSTERFVGYSGVGPLPLLKYSLFRPSNPCRVDNDVFIPDDYASMVFVAGVSEAPTYPVVDWNPTRTTTMSSFSANAKSSSSSSSGAPSVRRVAKTVMVSASIVGSIAGKADTSSMTRAGRTDAFLQILHCESDTARELGFQSHPTQVGITPDGASPMSRSFVGAAVVNGWLMTGFVICHYGYYEYKKRQPLGPKDEPAGVATHHPSMTFRLLFYFMESFFISVLHVLVNVPSLSWMSSAAMGLLLYVGAVGVLSYPIGNLLKHVKYCEVPVPPRGRQESWVSYAITVYATNVGQYTDAKDSPGFCQQYGVLFRGFRPSRWWYLWVEMGILFALACTLSPLFVDCNVLNIAVVSMMTLNFLTFLIVDPCHTPYQKNTQIVLELIDLAALTTSMVRRLIQAESDSLLVDVSDVLLAISSVISGMAGVTRLTEKISQRIMHSQAMTTIRKQKNISKKPHTSTAQGKYNVELGEGGSLETPMINSRPTGEHTTNKNDHSDIHAATTTRLPLSSNKDKGFQV